MSKAFKVELKNKSPTMYFLQEMCKKNRKLVKT